MEQSHIINTSDFMKNMDISYLSTLDYVDMVNFCASDKKLSSICQNNNALRFIITQKNKNVILKKDFNIANALKDIYKSIQVIIDKNYPKETLPRWVDKKLFNDYILREFIIYFIERFIIEIIDIYENDEEPFDEITEIEISQELIISVLYSNDIDVDDFNCVRPSIFNTVIIPKSFYPYIILTINNLSEYTKYSDNNNDGYYELDNQNLHSALLDLLFIY